MNLCCRNNFAVLLALLTKRVLTDVAVTNPFPGSAILLVDVRSALVLVVLPPCYCCMILTVLSVCQLGASGVGT
jgi:hypothetical protein